MNVENLSKLKEYAKKPHKDVVNPQPRTLIFGYGWVGSFIKKYFTDADIFSNEFGIYINSEDMIYSLDKVKSIIKERKWNLGIICVPTPTSDSGECNITNIESIIEFWKDYVNSFLIKSTVEIGTTEKLRAKYKVPIVFSPEYTGETVHHPFSNHNPESFVILGGRKQDTSTISQYYKTVLNSNAVIRQVDSKTAEMCKYMENAFLATKVIFCNEFYDIAKLFDIDYDELREIWLLDQRVTRSHTFVYEDNRGFSGKCLPKDITALITTIKKQGAHAHLMEFILNRNNYYRLRSEDN